MFSAISSTGIAVSSGLVAYGVYQQQFGQKSVAELQQQQQKMFMEELSRVQYINLSSPYGSPATRGTTASPRFASQLDKEFSRSRTSSLSESYGSSFEGEREDLKMMVPRHLRKSWRLLHEANTGSYEGHIKAVQELSKLQLNDSEYRQLAQSCDIRTAVGLARSAGVDLRFFLPPPLTPSEFKNKELIQLFRDILVKLPADSEQVHDCIKYFTSEALDSYLHSCEEEVYDSDISFEFHRESHHIHSIPRPVISQELMIEYCLQALLSHSTISEQCQVIVESLTLPLLTLVCEAFPDNVRIKSIIGKILSNISLHPEYHRAVWQAGWVGLLAEWKQDPNILVSLPATKALCNLDQEFGGHKYGPGIYLMLPNDRHVQHKNNRSNWGVDVVFVHGLMGGVFYTWRQFDPENVREFSNDQISEDSYSYCWPRDWLAEDANNVRVIGCDFDSYITQWGGSCPTQNFKQSLAERSEDMLKKLQDAGVGNRPVIFVGHSMGGLIIKKMLTEAKESEDESMKKLAENTKGVVFYSTPHEGSKIADMGMMIRHFFFPTVEVQELEMKNPALTSLNTSFKEFVAKFRTKVISFGEQLPTRHLGVDLTFVPPESSDPGVGEFISVPFNHMNICKPENKKSILFRKFYNMVWDALDEASPTIG